MSEVPLLPPPDPLHVQEVAQHTSTFASSTLSASTSTPAQTLVAVLLTSPLPPTPATSPTSPTTLPPVPAPSTHQSLSITSPLAQPPINTLPSLPTTTTSTPSVAMPPAHKLSSSSTLPSAAATQ